MRTTTLATVLATLALAPGCHHDRNDIDVSTSFAEFQYEGDFDHYTDVEQYRWETPLEQAFVDFEAFDFHGELRIEILDNHDVLIYDVLFIGDGGDFFVEDETLVGDPGEWIIVITAHDAHGFVRLTLF